MLPLKSKLRWLLMVEISWEIKNSKCENRFLTLTEQEITAEVPVRYILAREGSS